jgi:hypothetical protein
MKFIKGFLRGLLYVVLSPLILAAFALYAVYSVFIYIGSFFVATFKFFTGNKLTCKLREDKILEEYIAKKKKEEEEEEDEAEEEEKPAQTQQPIIVQTPPTNNGPTTINNFYITPDQLNTALNLHKQPENKAIEQQEPKLIEEKTEEGGENDE